MAMMISYHVGKNTAAVVETDHDGVSYEYFPSCSKAEKNEFFELYHGVPAVCRHVTGLVFSVFVGAAVFAGDASKNVRAASDL